MDWKQEIISQTHVALQKPIVALGISGGTAATGSATWMGWIPTNIGFYASAVAFLVSVATLYSVIKGVQMRIAAEGRDRELDRLKMEKFQLEIERLKGDKDGD